MITNNGAATQTNLPVTLNVTGADTFTDTQTIPSLASCGGQAIVTFAAFTPGALGSDTVAVSVPADDFAANNSLSKALNITALNYSYKYPGSTASGGVGVTGATATFVGKFTTTAANAVTDVKLEFLATSATTYRVAIYGDNAGTPSTTALYVDAADRTVTVAGPVTITLPSPVAVGPGNFYVGIQQTNTTNVGLSFDTENPIRSGSFFLAIPIGAVGTAWFDEAPGNNFKLNIGLILQNACPSPTPTATATATATARHAYGYANTDCDSYGYANTDCDSYGYANTDCDSYGYANTDCDSYGYSNRHGYRLPRLQQPLPLPRQSHQPRHQRQRRHQARACSFMTRRTMPGECNRFSKL